MLLFTHLQTFPTIRLRNSYAIIQPPTSGLTSNVPGTLFTWTCTPSSVNLSGFYNNITPSGLFDQTLVNTGFTVETVTYQITPTANGCAGPVSDYIVTVFPTPDLSNVPLSSQVCNNTATGIKLMSNVTGTLFTWTCTPSSGNVSGYYNNFAPSGLLDQTLINSGLNIETVTYHITPHANGCDGPVTDFIVTVGLLTGCLFQSPSPDHLFVANPPISSCFHMFPGRLLPGRLPVPRFIAYWVLGRVRKHDSTTVIQFRNYSGNCYLYCYP